MALPVALDPVRGRAWGKGYAAEGSRALIRKGFTELGVQRVVAGAMAVNTAWRRVMEKAGLRLVPTFHQPWPYPVDGGQFGDVEYALDKADWQQQDQPGAGAVALPADLVGSRGQQPGDRAVAAFGQGAEDHPVGEQG
ncbi:MAG: GNAT family N-acetyltransferase [Streptosporangiaceae bacterium]